MWCIARIDNLNEYFGLVWAYRLRDLPSFDEVRRTSGFVGPNDKLAILRPDGSIKSLD